MRKSRAKKRILMADPRHNDILVTRFVNNIMQDGKKSTAYKIFYDALDVVTEKTKEDGYEVWKKAMQNVMPAVEVKSKRIGGSNFQIPIEIRPDRKIAIGMRWLIDYSKKRNGKSMCEKLSAEIISASNGEGASVKKRDDVHRMADANKAFSHFKA